MTKRLLVALVAAAVLVGTVYSAASLYQIFLLTSGAVAVLSMQSYGLITGRAGVISLCQLSFAAIGAWVVGWCNLAGVPGGFYLWLVLGGLAAVVAGLAIGLPALRLRGVNLAVATFAFATSLDVVFGAIDFPGQDEFNFVRRPEPFTADRDYFLLAAIVVAALFVLLRWLDRSKIGGAWLEIRESERAAAAHGISVTMGMLAGNLKPDRVIGKDPGGIRDRVAGAAGRLAEIASTMDATAAQVAVAFCLTHPAITTVLFGASKQAQLAENLGAVALAERRGQEIRAAVADLWLDRDVVDPSGKS